MELILGTTSMGCIFAAVFLCLMDLLFYVLDLAHSPLVVEGVLDPRYLNVLPRWQELFFALVVAIPVSDLLQVTSIMAILLLGAAAILRRFGRRFALADAIVAQETDSRPPVVYLRNFSDDALKMPSSSLARTSLTERFSVVRLQPFEEILVRHLRTLGPVIALSHPGTRIPVIGAARVTCSDETWQSQIREWVGRASIVVVAVTPREMSPGLKWEIQFLATEAAHVPVLLVVSPYKRDEVEARWRMFCADAMRFPRFRWLEYFFEHNSGAHFMAERPEAGWVAWGANKRSEYTYAVSFAEASKAVAGRQLLSADDTVRQPRWARDAFRRKLDEAGGEA